ncbi:DUF7556 family protein [Salinilacihabitans rarus]|uniref:DUF7556 family protein n=1 Tax=Salinilacihabitans rarus TaxID=2961596 RepID=UPI0020C8608D|nr:hypothetical protein [Salinilacihabitans rarus]
MVVEHSQRAPTRSETVVSAIDSDGTTAQYVIADISADGAWLSMAAEDAPTLPAWR